MAALFALTGIVNMLRGAGESILNRVEKASHERAALGILKTYFYLKDLAAEADALFSDVRHLPPKGGRL
jgi:hypothetical protein